MTGSRVSRSLVEGIPALFRRPETKWILGIIAGIPLLVLAAWIETALETGVAAAAFIEEGIKGAAALAIFLSSRKDSVESRLALPAAPAIGFGLAENIAYMAAFPDTSTWARIPTALFLHCASGLLFALAMDRARSLKKAPRNLARAICFLVALIVAGSWHAASNGLSFALSQGGAALVGGVAQTLALGVLSYLLVARLAREGLPR